MEIKDNEYKCAHCGNIYEYGWSNDEARAEARANFGKNPEEWLGGQAIICDDCYELMRPDKFPHLVEKVKEKI